MLQGLVRLRDLGFRPGGILDVGAYDGDFARSAREIFCEAHILMIEAMAEKSGKLASVCRELGNAEYLVALVGETEVDEVSFFVVNTEIRPDLVKTGSSKYKENANFPTEERGLPQRTLQSILASRDAPFELLKLDVQGAELDVIRGLGARLLTVEVILIELSLVEYNKGGPLIATVLSELDKLGFVLYDIVDEHRHWGGGLLQIDGLFVRPRSRCRLHPPFWN
jgi:FkbM family methyltransferase